MLNKLREAIKTNTDYHTGRESGHQFASGNPDISISESEDFAKGFVVGVVERQKELAKPAWRRALGI